MNWQDRGLIVSPTRRFANIPSAQILLKVVSLTNRNKRCTCIYLSNKTKMSDTSFFKPLIRRKEVRELAYKHCTLAK